MNEKTRGVSSMLADSRISAPNPLPPPRNSPVIAPAITPTEVEETVDFKLPKNAKPGQILHIVVPGQHELQAVRVPPGAKAGMMLSVKVPKTALEEEAAGEGEGAGAGEGEGEGEARAGGEETVVEEVEEDAEIVEEDVVFTWTHFFLLIFFVGLGTMIVFYFVKRHARKLSLSISLSRRCLWHRAHSRRII